ncbi:hypothetical protein GN956_G15542 [Arapaima gigas]
MSPIPPLVRPRFSAGDVVMSQRHHDDLTRAQRAVEMVGPNTKNETDGPSGMGWTQAWVLDPSCSVSAKLRLTGRLRRRKIFVAALVGVTSSTYSLQRCVSTAVTLEL